MDVELARTFLEIVSTGSFVQAAERLNVAQTTVSARIRVLEERLGRPLFVRNKSGASLTPAGEQLLRYAPTFVQLWQPLLLDWVLWLRRTFPEIALRVQVDVPQDLINQVAAGLVDVAVMYAPPHRPGLTVDLLLEEKLVMVTSDPKAGAGVATDLISVDWGPSFARDYNASFPEAQSQALFTNLGPFALSYILAAGGSGYCRMHVVEPYLASGQLHLVPGMPQFSYPIFVVYPTDFDDPLIGPALAGLRMVSSMDRTGSI